MRFYFSKLWKWIISLTIQGSHNLGPVMATINIHERGTTYTQLLPMHPNAQLLTAAISESFVDQWNTVCLLTPIEAAAWQQMTNEMYAKGISLPYLMSLKEIEKNRIGLADNREVS